MKSKTFTHLTDADRVRIEVLLEEGKTPSEIADMLGVNRSTVGREVKHRGTPTGYHAATAALDYDRKRSVCRPKRIMEETPLGSLVIDRIKQGWSPEVIAGRLKKEIKEGKRLAREFVNHETIYQFVYQSEYGKQEKLYQYLKRGKKHRTHKYGRRSQKETIPNRIFIDDRPAVVDERSRLGDWEGDSIIYPNKQAINSLVERKSRYVLLTKLARKTALLTQQAVVERLQDLPHQTLTVDNGSENTNHEAVTQALGMPVYFCHPYHSWEKGTNENTNGLVRRYLPRGHSIEPVTQNDIDDIAWELNNRPRKRLDYSTPHEVLQSNCCI